jgi:L-serine dehydratase
MISTFDLFKIGIGPSSSHTVGPMVAAKHFRDALKSDICRVTVELFGSLAWTGKGHGSDSAICLGLLGETPADINPDEVANRVSELESAKRFRLDDGQWVDFDCAADLIFDLKMLLPVHSNGMRFRALARDGDCVIEKIYYSIGGGFVVEDGKDAPTMPVQMPYPFANAAELLKLSTENECSVAALQMANEMALRPRKQVEKALDTIRDTMFDCIDRGLRMEGVLPGKLKVRRRAKGLMERLEASRRSNQSRPHEVMDWISTYAIAVNEENAAGGRVVTAPTNGAAGIVPAVLRYFREFCSEYSTENSRIFLLSAAAIGSIIKRNASISGAEAGCQGEVGSAASMAAAGLAAVLGGTPGQVENAAEIAMEHHLGMTCDPIGGLVQIPCIERNAFGANKAIAAASLALKGDGTHRVSLDEVIETMRQTGIDMQSKYKETSQGGLAVNVAEC